MIFNKNDLMSIKRALYLLCGERVPSLSNIVFKKFLLTFFMVVKYTLPKIYHFNHF